MLGRVCQATIHPVICVRCVVPLAKVLPARWPKPIASLAGIGLWPGYPRFKVLWSIQALRRIGLRPDRNQQPEKSALLRLC